MVRHFPLFNIALLFFCGTFFSNNLSASTNTKNISKKAFESLTITLGDCQLSVDAGFDLITCEGTSIQLMAEIQGAATMVNWSSLSGNGDFDDPTIINPIFTPGSEDIGGTISLEFTAIDEVSDCQASDVLELTIFRLPEVSAGENIMVCEGEMIQLNGLVDEEDYLIEWEGGTGLFANIFSSETTYTPTILDPNPLVLTLTARDPVGTCEAVRSDITITFADSPIIDAGSDSSICGTTPYELSISSSVPISENADRFEWTTDGAGVFDDPELLVPVYFPDASDVGTTVTLTIKAFGDENCEPAVDQLELVINNDPLVDAGSDEVTFVDQPFKLDQSAMTPIAEHVLSYLWTTNGDGTFNDPTLLHPIYTPVESDENKEIRLTLTVQGYCESISDDMILKVESIVLGIDINEDRSGLKVYLDARNKDLVVEFGTVQTRDSAWQMFDLSGKLYMKGRIGAGNDRYLIGLEGVKEGVFVFKVENISRKLLLYN